ncbi:polyphosphate:AMP phosphotransferase [Halopseudomonas pachastrellae]|uniref:polyphosphate:AMP phosphotransferase n=1 Tax=Halopseudomonas pachastrellae TaxID=254161 RepID=UPI003D7DCCC7|tara:strand:+ start:159 stop:1613 length:1455 start_codon:yes stop_codon:yes gene_type:complete
MSDKEHHRKRKAEREALREALLETQFELRTLQHGSVLLLISGNDFAGKAEIIHSFYEWLDNRYLNTRAFALPKGVERRMPRLWRYWRTLPPAGELGFYLGSWYHQPLMRLSRGQLSIPRFTTQMQQILRFERLLNDEGITLVKIWLYLGDNEQDSRQRRDLAQRKQTVAMREWGDFSAADYEKVREGARLMTELTSTQGAPWIRVPAADPHERDQRIGQIVLDAMQQRLANPPTSTPVYGWQPAQRDYLAQLDYSLALDKDDYQQQLEHWQGRLRALIQHPRFARRNLLLVFEGSDAAGKGGTIRRITQCLDPRILRVHGTRAPTDEERRMPYLWRFWRRIPAPGNVVVFDRSYYGRVLVERVEGFCDEPDWQRAYGEINDFEQQLSDSGTLIIKFWLAITEDEQLKRFKAREDSPVKRYKLTEEDWRNRKRWPDYVQAMNDMVEHTSTRNAPWHLIPAQNKRYARIQALRILCETLNDALGPT